MKHTCVNTQHGWVTNTRNSNEFCMLSQDPTLVLIWLLFKLTWQVNFTSYNLSSHLKRGMRAGWQINLSSQLVTPVARSIFWFENRAIFSESFFGRGIFGRSITCIQLVPSNWLWRGFLNHKRREHVQWRNFIKEGFIKEENTFNEGISLPWRRPSLLDPFHEITGLLQIERNFLVEWVIRTIFYEGISLRKKLSEKIARFSTQKIDPATGVKLTGLSSGSCHRKWDLSRTQKNWCDRRTSSWNLLHTALDQGI